MPKPFAELFPETPSISLTPKHIKVVKELMGREKPLSNKKLIENTGIDKTTISEIKSDLIALKWCSEISHSNGKEVYLRVSRKNEINKFLDGWASLGKSLLLRPHHIILNGIMGNDNLGLNRSLNKISKDPRCRVIISPINNNVEYIIQLKDEGKIAIFESSRLIKFFIDDFILPVNSDNLDLLKDYIIYGITSRFTSLADFISPFLERSRIRLNSSMRLGKMHLGIITKDNVSTIISQTKLMKDLGLIVDKSIYGCKEIEAEGDLDIIVNKMSAFINTLIEKGEL